MPTYQYRCPECGHEFETFQPMTEDAIKDCPECGKETRRVISGGAGLLFKGSGFYTTDYRSEGYNKAAKSDSSAASPPKSDSKSSKTSESSSSSTKPSNVSSSSKKSSD